MSSTAARIIRDYLSMDEPFGPIDARDISDPKAYEILFERHNKIHRSLHKRPSIILGRKGSGKTSYLNTVYFDSSYTHVVELNTSEAFSSVIQSISSISSGLIFVESVKEVWRVVIYIGFFCEVREKLSLNSRARALINDYLAKIGLRDKGTLEDTLWTITDIISKYAKEKAYGVIPDLLKLFDNVTFESVLKVLESEFEKGKYRAVLLLDSLDDFQLHIDAVGRAVQGLLKFIGETNKPSAHIDIRFCLPAELYHHFMKLSSNPNKDFKRRLLLHWTAPELVSLAAHRLILFSHAYQDHPLAITDDLENVDRGLSAQVLKRILPESVMCGLGVYEDPIAYILRHTQLLPRHLLIILNSICDKFRRFPDATLNIISEEAIRRGVAAVEDVLVQEIFAAYRSVYPRASAVCKACLPELQHKFSIGDLERVFRSQGKKSMETVDFSDFKRMLVEMGVIGRVLDDTHRYIQAEFEYTVPHQLITSTEDMLCIHPLFTKVFSVKTRERKPVYPYGARLEDKDYRGDYQ
jgi:hypothetical protein